MSAHPVVLRRKHGDEMCWVDTPSDPAEVVKMHSIWNGSSLTFVDPAVSHPVRPSNVEVGVTARPTVALAGQVPDPVVAWGLVSHVAEFPLPELLGCPEFSMDVTGGEEGGLSASAGAERCLIHEHNTNKDALSPKEGRAWQ